MPAPTAPTAPTAASTARRVTRSQTRTHAVTSASSVVVAHLANDPYLLVQQRYKAITSRQLAEEARRAEQAALAARLRDEADELATIGSSDNLTVATGTEEMQPLAHTSHIVRGDTAMELEDSEIVAADFMAPPPADPMQSRAVAEDDEEIDRIFNMPMDVESPSSPLLCAERCCLTPVDLFRTESMLAPADMEARAEQVRHLLVAGFGIDAMGPVDFWLQHVYPGYEQLRAEGDNSLAKLRDHVFQALKWHGWVDIDTMLHYYGPQYFVGMDA